MSLSSSKYLASVYFQMGLMESTGMSLATEAHFHSSTGALSL